MPYVALSAIAKQAAQKQGRLSFIPLARGYFRLVQDPSMPKFRKSQIDGLWNQAFPKNRAHTPKAKPVKKVLLQTEPHRIPQKGESSANCPECGAKNWLVTVNAKNKCTNKSCRQTFFVDKFRR